MGVFGGEGERGSGEGGGGGGEEEGDSWEMVCWKSHSVWLQERDDMQRPYVEMLHRRALDRD